MRRFLVLAVAALWSAPASAVETVCVNLGDDPSCDFTSLTDALNSGSFDGTIELGPGFVESVRRDFNAMTLTLRGVTFPGVSGARPLFDNTQNDVFQVKQGTNLTLESLDMVGGGRCIEIKDANTSVTLIDVVLDDCDRDQNGAAIQMEQDSQSLTIRGGSFVDNDSTNGSGGVLEARGTVTIEAWAAGGGLPPTFTNNTASINGGAINVFGNATVTIHDAVFVDSEAPGLGGAIWVQSGAVLDVFSTSFDTNRTTGGDGGAIACQGTCSVTGSDFVDNEAQGTYGGAIYVSSGGSLLVDGGSFRQVALTSPAATQGGAIAVDGGTLDVVDTSGAPTVFEDLIADDLGGAIWMTGSNDATITGASFQRNTTPNNNGDGSAVWWDASGVLTVDGCDFVGNVASDDGTIRVRGGFGAFSNNLFDGNQANQGAGILFEVSGSDSGSVYQGNTAFEGGGGIATRAGNGSLDLTNVSFLNNHSDLHGGAVRLEDTETGVFSGCTFTGNTAVLSGGQVYSVHGSAPVDLSIDNSSFSGGDTGEWGGAIAASDNTSLTLDTCDFSGNTADNDGGAIDFSPATASAVLSIVSSTFDGNDGDLDGTGNGDGGAIWANTGFVSIADTHFDDNVAERGGALFFSSGIGDFDLVRNTFCANTAADEGGALWANAIGESAPRSIRNHAFTDNSATNGGGAIRISSSDVDLVNNTIVGSTSGSDEGAVWLDGVGGQVVNNLIADSVGGGLWTNGLTATRDYNLYDSNGVGDVLIGGSGPWTAYATNDIAGQDPLLAGFVPRDGDCTNDLLYLLSGSPAIDNGDPAISDFDGSRSDIGAYGGPDMDTTLLADNDGDGQSPLDGDCDDDNANAYFGNPVEIAGDGVDGDCNGTEACYIDADLDGFGGGTIGFSPNLACTDPGNSPTGDDCDDANAGRYPGLAEIVADGIDQDCNFEELCWDDNDFDDYGTTATVGSADFTCTSGSVAAVSGDCDDTDATVNPGAAEVTGDGTDQDCDGTEQCFTDGDGDTYGSPTITLSTTDTLCDGPGEADDDLDCDDSSPTVYPGAPEVVADQIDQDCDLQEDCWQDADGDGFGNNVNVVPSADTDCTDAGESAFDTDCDDTVDTVFPGALEVVANGRDDSCDGLEACYEDLDGDGAGGSGTVDSSDLDCTDGGEAPLSDDCDDGSSAIRPGVAEIPADGTDQNCDGLEACHADADGDGDGNDQGLLQDSTSIICFEVGVSAVDTDCDDGDPLTYDGAPEIIADGKDQSCDGEEECWDDGDGDGFAGNLVTGFTTALDCNDPPLAVAPVDCDDIDNAVYPGATEIVANGIDESCDGQEACYDDADLDGFGTDTGATRSSTDLDCTDPFESATADDCNDANNAAYPGASELVANDSDEDCNGKEMCYADLDQDLFGSTDLKESADGDLVCAGNKVSDVSTDCDDADAAVNPLAIEAVANGADDNCDNFELCWLDDDADGVGGTGTTLSADLDCLDANESELNTDCDDNDPGRFPGNPEIPNDGIDQNCDLVDLTGCFQDSDLDGVGGTIVVFGYDPNCTSLGVSTLDTDCDDFDASIFPGAYDGCNGVDNDCDGFGGGDSDWDGDDLVWDTEVLMGLDDCDEDVDDDGVWDGDEDTLGMDPLDADSDGDGAPDGVEIGVGALDPRDTDGDGTIDPLDDDDDGDGVPTVTEDVDGDGDPTNDDTDANGTNDYLDVDDDGDLLTTVIEDLDGDGDPTNDDTDGDLLPNYLDPDDDNDGISSFDENSVGADPYGGDSDGDGISDSLEWIFGDTDGDGLPNIIDGDDDGDGIPTVIETAGDANGDGEPNYLDDDSDGDGKLDVIEGQGDDDGDTIPNFLDPDDSDGGTGDGDGDGIVTTDELTLLDTDPIDPDTDGDGVHDGVEAPDVLAPRNTDGDPLIDALDDDDGDGVPTRDELGDECTDGSGIQVLTVAFEVVYQCADGSVPFDDSTRVYLDTDSDGTPDYLDIDDDGDGVSTLDEDRNGNGDPLDDDLDGDALPDYLDADDADGPLGDSDGDGLANGDEEAVGSDPLRADTDGDGISDAIEDAAGDTDGDGVADVLDEDDDGDGIPTAEEGAGDIDGDGVPNYLDADADGDGRSDADEGTDDLDCDGNPNWSDADDSDYTCTPDTGTGELETIEWSGCDGCNSSGAPSWAWVLALAGLAARRRRGQAPS